MHDLRQRADHKCWAMAEDMEKLEKENKELKEALKESESIFNRIMTEINPKSLMTDMSTDDRRFDISREILNLKAKHNEKRMV